MSRQPRWKALGNQVVRAKGGCRGGEDRCEQGLGHIALEINPQCTFET